MFSKIKFLNLILFIVLFFQSSVFSDIIKEIEIRGNERISDKTILMFSKTETGDNISENDLNLIIKNLYNTNYFKNISTSIINDKLIISVEENPVIGIIEIKGVKAKKNIKAIKENLKLKNRSSFSEFLLEKDKKQIFSNLKNMGFYFPTVDVYIKENDNKVLDIVYEIDIGEKAKIGKITFTGDKIFKDRKLKSIIISEEYKPWKFISGKKYLNENLIEVDRRLLNNFYINNGYYNVKINSSFAKLIEEESFELVFNIEANKIFYFDNLTLTLPDDFNEENFESIYKLFSKLKNKPYSILRIENILDSIDNISTTQQFESTKSSVVEDIKDNKINLNFIIEDIDRTFVEKINIYNNNVTRENVIRNKLELDEGDPFNEILLSRSINNIKSLNFFRSVEQEVVPGNKPNTKIINLTVDEKPTGEIMAGAGFGTSGGSLSFGVRENNYMGKGLSVDGNLILKEDSIKGRFSVINPNINNSDKSVSASVQSTEINKLTAFGYKTNKTGLSLATSFEYLNNLNLGIGFESAFEKIETDSTASARQKKQAGNYFDNFLNLSIDYDKRNQKFQTSDGFRSFYKLKLPLISETNTLTNSYSFSNYTKYNSSNIFKASIFFKSSFSLTDEDIKLSERLNIPSSKLRGFETDKVGPKDGNDYVGGNFMGSLNISSTVPQILPNSQNTDFIVFLDVANVWGVDYDSSLGQSNDIRSSIGIGLDWFSVVGPVNFTVAQPITKDSNDKTESFRFNLGTTF